MYRMTVCVLSSLVATLAPMMEAHANALTITYFTINSNNPDANHLAFGVFTNEVQNGLGTDGLPLLNIPQFGCASNCYTVAGAPGFPLPAGTGPNVNVNSQGEITYWDPTLNPYVTQTLQTTTTLPFSSPVNFFPPNGTGSSDGGANGYQAAILSGILNTASTQQLSFAIGSDDMAFAYIDGSLVCSDGGVHGSASVPCTTPTVNAGDHTFDLFFVDINQVQSGLTFSISTQNVTTNPNPGGTVPEPSTIGLLGAGLLGAAAARLRKKEAS